MNFLFRFVFAFLAFTIDVRVKASSTVEEQPPTTNVESGQIIQLPERCLQSSKNQGCTLWVKSVRFIIPTENHQQVVAGQDSLVIRQSEDRWKMVEGTLFAESEKKFFIQTLFGVVSVEGSGVIVETTSKQVRVHALKGVVKVSPADGKEQLQLPAGYQLSLSALDSKGRSAVSVPQPVHLQSLIRVWFDLYPGNKSGFKEALRKFVPTWQSALDSAGDWHKSLVNRQLAAIAEEEGRRLQRQRELEKENQALRKMFREKNYLE